MKETVDDSEQISMISRCVHGAAAVLLVESIAEPLHQSCPLGVVAAHEVVRPRQHLKISQDLQACLAPVCSIGAVKEHSRQNARRYQQILPTWSGSCLQSGLPLPAFPGLPKPASSIFTCAQERCTKKCVKVDMHSHSSSFASLEW